MGAFIQPGNEGVFTCYGLRFGRWQGWVLGIFPVVHLAGAGGRLWLVWVWLIEEFPGGRLWLDPATWVIFQSRLPVAWQNGVGLC